LVCPPWHGTALAANIAFDPRRNRDGDDQSQGRAHVWLVDELPKGPTGKILKREIQVPIDVSAG
jgi:hypothetical protein